jgi:hypothetical protein
LDDKVHVVDAAHAHAHVQVSDLVNLETPPPF